MKKLVVDLGKYSVIIFMTLIGMFMLLLFFLTIFSFFSGKDFNLIPSIFTITASNNNLVSKSVEINFGHNLGYQILLIYICLTFFVFGIVYSRRENVSFILVTLLAISLWIFGFFCSSYIDCFVSNIHS